MSDALNVLLTRKIILELSQDDLSIQLGTTTDELIEIEEFGRDVDKDLLLNLKIMVFEKVGFFVDDLYQNILNAIEEKYYKFIVKLSNETWLDIAADHKLIAFDLYENEFMIAYSTYYNTLNSTQFYCYTGNTEYDDCTIYKLLPIFRRYFGKEDMDEDQFYIRINNSEYLDIVAPVEFKRAYDSFDTYLIEEQMVIWFEDRCVRNG